MRYLLSLIILVLPVAAFAHIEFYNIASLPGLLHYLLSPHHLPLVIVLCVVIIVFAQRGSRGQKF